MKKFKLDPVVKAKWVAALRSGKYEQGKGYLKDGNSYCCLGVAVEEKLCFPSKIAPNHMIEDGFLPQSVITKLIEYNDGVNGFGDKSFKWIAAVIEKWL